MSLSGRSVVVCRAINQATPLIAGLHAAGAVPIHVPLLATEPPVDDGTALREALSAATDTTWLALTSGNGVDAVAAEIEGGVEVPGPVAVVGAATGARAAAHGWTVDFVSSEPSAAGLGRTLPVRAGERVLAAVAELAGDDLPRALADRGIAVDVVTAYRTTVPEVSAADLDRLTGADAIIVTSPSVVDRLVDLLGSVGLPALVAIGDTTASAIRRHGLPLGAIAGEPSVDGLIDAVVRTLDP